MVVLCHVASFEFLNERTVVPRLKKKEKKMQVK